MFQSMFTAIEHFTYGRASRGQLKTKCILVSKQPIDVTSPLP